MLSDIVDVDKYADEVVCQFDENKQYQQMNGIDFDVISRFIMKSAIPQPTPQVLYQKLNSKMDEMEKLHQSDMKEQQKNLLNIFYSVWKKMDAQLKNAKQRYNTINKQQLKNAKSQGLAKEIKFFRDQCRYLKHKIADAKQQLQQEKLKNDITERENQAYHQNIKRKRAQSLAAKLNYEKLKDNFTFPNKNYQTLLQDKTPTNHKSIQKSITPLETNSNTQQLQPFNHLTNNKFIHKQQPYFKLSNRRSKKLSYTTQKPI